MVDLTSATTAGKAPMVTVKAKHTHSAITQIYRGSQRKRSHTRKNGHTFIFDGMLKCVLYATVMVRHQISELSMTPCMLSVCKPIWMPSLSKGEIKRSKGKIKRSKGEVRLALAINDTMPRYVVSKRCINMTSIKPGR